MTAPKPRQPAPALEVATLDGPVWRLAERRPERFTLIVFYRGLHCPICSRYIRDLDRRLGEFAERGTEAIAVSTDSEDRARRSRADWGLEALTVGYGLPIEAARAWGLYISSGRGKTSVGIDEPALFNEPGLFLVRADGTLYAASVQTMPFVRPSFAELLKALDVIIERDYPARGEA